MFSGYTYKNPFNPNEYIIYEEYGWEEVYIGLFKILKPKRKIIGFMTEEFIRDNAMLGIKVIFDGENFIRTISF